MTFVLLWWVLAELQASELNCEPNSCDLLKGLLSYEIHALNIYRGVHVVYPCTKFIGYSKEKSELDYLQKSHHCVGKTFHILVMKTNVVKNSFLTRWWNEQDDDFWTEICESH